MPRSNKEIPIIGALLGVLILYIFVLGVALSYRPPETHYFTKPSEVREFIQNCDGNALIAKNYVHGYYEAQCDGVLKDD
jgi:hypothetical protein